MKRRSQAALPANRYNIHFLLHKRLNNFHSHVPTKVHPYRLDISFSDSQPEPPLFYILLPFSLSISNQRALLWIVSLLFLKSKIRVLRGNLICLFCHQILHTFRLFGHPLDKESSTLYKRTFLHCWRWEEEAQTLKSCSYFALFSPDSKLKNHKEMYSSIFIENFSYQSQDILFLGSIYVRQAKTYSSSLVSVLHNIFFSSELSDGQQLPLVTE